MQLSVPQLCTLVFPKYSSPHLYKVQNISDVMQMALKLRWWRSLIFTRS